MPLCRIAELNQANRERDRIRIGHERKQGSNHGANVVGKQWKQGTGKIGN